MNSRCPSVAATRPSAQGRRWRFGGWVAWVLSGLFVLAPGASPGTAAAAKHWAYEPLSNPRPPAVSETGWGRNAIDRFIEARLDAVGLRPAPDADPHTWLRRVTLDLTGLPPTDDEIRSFVDDPSPRVREQVVDRLLASHAFGERWARHWLDLVGYADQLGTVNDVPAPHAWRYRDYVIRAFNADKPFDRFVREQIAGDLLPESDPAIRQESMVATGFLLLGEIHIVTADKMQLRADIVDHQIQKVGMTFLGQSLGCVRCHDHKFDPIRQEEYYGLAGIFGSTESSYVTERGVWSTLLSVELPESESQRAERERAWGDHLVQVEKLKAERANLARELAEVKRRLEPVTNVTTAVNAGGVVVANQAGTARLVEAKPSDVAGSSVDLPARRKELEGKMGSIDNRLLHLAYLEPRAAYAYAVRDVPKPTDEPIHHRGNPRAPGRVVPRGFVRAMSSSATAAATIPAGVSGRRELAEWLVDPANPLPARVTVNRIWQKLFGEGLVRTVDYFGTRGDAPTHPELLDWLAGEFLRQGGSHKRLIREIALSRAYGQSSVEDAEAAARDPDNRWLGRMKARRLEAEALRDTILAVSGELLPHAGGPALALDRPENIGGLDPKDVNPVSFRTSTFPEAQYRYRTIYLPVVRSRAQPGPAEIRNLFDFPLPTEMTGQRPTTGVATQALFLMNSEFMKTQAGKLAAWVLRLEVTEPRARLERLYLRALGRPAGSAELDLGVRFLDQGHESDPAHRVAAWTEFCHALLSSNEFLFRL